MMAQFIAVTALPREDLLDRLPRTKLLINVDTITIVSPLHDGERGACISFDHEEETKSIHTIETVDEIEILLATPQLRRPVPGTPVGMSIG